MATKVQLVGAYHVVQVARSSRTNASLHIVKFNGMKERCTALRAAADWMLANPGMSPMDLIRCDECGNPVECTPAADILPSTGGNLTAITAAS